MCDYLPYQGVNIELTIILEVNKRARGSLRSFGVSTEGSLSSYLCSAGILPVSVAKIRCIPQIYLLSLSFFLCV